MSAADDGSVHVTRFTVWIVIVVDIIIVAVSYCLLLAQKKINQEGKEGDFNLYHAALYYITFTYVVFVVALHSCSASFVQYRSILTRRLRASSPSATCLVRAVAFAFATMANSMLSVLLYVWTCAVVSLGVAGPADPTFVFCSRVSLCVRMCMCSCVGIPYSPRGLQDAAAREGAAALHRPQHDISVTRGLCAVSHVNLCVQECVRERVCVCFANSIWTFPL